MKTVLIYIATALLAAAGAYGYLGEVVATFNAPAYYPSSIAAGGDYLYVYCNGRYLPPFYYIFILNPSTGGRVGSYPSPFSGTTRGLGCEFGGYLWLGRSDTSYVGRARGSDGSIYSSWPVTAHPIGSGIDCQGNPGVGGTLTAIIAAGGSIVSRHTTSGSFLSSFVAAASMRDPAWDYRNGLIWGLNAAASGGVCRGYTTAGSLIASFGAPGSYGSALAYYGDYLYMTTSSGSGDSIYKIHCPSVYPAVAPASLGRVKAIYH